MGSWLCALCPSKTKWDRERVEMGLEVRALCASEIKQYKQRADKFQTFMSLLVKEDFKPSWVPFKYFPSLKMCTWSLHMRLVMPELAHKIQSYNLGKKISNLHGSLSWEPTPLAFSYKITPVLTIFCMEKYLLIHPVSNSIALIKASAAVQGPLVLV